MLINSLSKKWLDTFIENPSSTLFIDTSEDTTAGIDICHYIHAKLISSPSSPMIILGNTDMPSIGIDDIRSFQHSLLLKADRTDSDISRIAVVQRADGLTVEAQNALLKLIEEPPARTLIILVAASKKGIVPTILSRCIVLPLLPLDTVTAEGYALAHGFDLSTVTQALMISEGRSTSFIALLEDTGNNDLKKNIADAKQYLSSSVFDRLQQVDTLIKEKQLVALLASLKLVAKTGMRNAQDTAVKQQWKLKLKVLLETEVLLQANVAQKLLLLRLSVLL